MKYQTTSEALDIIVGFFICVVIVVGTITGMISRLETEPAKNIEIVTDINVKSDTEVIITGEGK